MADLTRLVNPRTVAIIGASATPNSPGHSAVQNVLRHSRIEGSVYLVNPSRREIEGHPCLATVDELPANEVDTALVVVPAAAVVETIEACARRGVSNAVIPVGGLSETGEAGRAEEAKLQAIARRSGIRLYGPNCPGLTNVQDSVYLSVSPGASHDTTPGHIGLITQGGALGRNIMQYGDRGVGIGCWFSAGNEVDLELSDFVEHFISDDRITAIACIIEGFRDGARFLRVAQEAGEAGKPVVALVLGRSATGAQAAQSHTAHMATTDRVVSSLLRQHGVTVVDDIDELVDQAALLGRGVRPAHLAPVVISFSGGAAVAAADALEMAGIPPAVLRPATRDRIAEVMPSFGTVANPLDLTMDAMRRFEIVSGSVAALADDPEVNALVVSVPGDYAQITARFVQETLAFEGPGRHVIPIWSSPRRGEGCTDLEARGLLPFATASGMARALARAHEYRLWTDRRARTETTRSPVPPAGNRTGAHQTGAGRTGAPDGPLVEFEAKRLLAEYGMTIPEGALCPDRDSAVATAAELGYPVAMKVQSRSLQHKTEAGGVVLGVRSADEVATAWEQLIDASRKAGLGADALDGVLVERMASPGTDLIVSVRHDPVFGRLSAVGLGGIFTEVLGDIVFLAGRPGAQELEALLRPLVGWPVLAGARGSRPVDLAGLAEVLAMLDTLVAAEELDEIEINPLRSISSDGTLVALDTLAIPRQSASG
jgi:acyl-CoA synthetase (NDP forming)